MLHSDQALGHPVSEREGEGGREEGEKGEEEGKEASAHVSIH